jgi:hypothetical protein
MRWRFRAGGRLLNAVRAVDTVTHPEYRRYGIFSTLTRNAVAQAVQENIDLVFNTPNNDVLPGYLKLGWRSVGMIRPYIRIVNYPRFAAGVLRNRKARSSTADSSSEGYFRILLPSASEFLKENASIVKDALARRQTNDRHLTTDQSPVYLRWRYSEYPNARYVVYHELEDKDRYGFAILRTNRRFGLKEVVIDELFLSRPDSKLAHQIMNGLRRSVTADYIIAYFNQGSLGHDAIRRQGFFQAPIGGMNFAVNTLSSVPVDATAPATWDVSLGDLEVF